MHNAQFPGWICLLPDGVEHRVEGLNRQLEDWNHNADERLQSELASNCTLQFQILSVGLGFRDPGIICHRRRCRWRLPCQTWRCYRVRRFLQRGRRRAGAQADDTQTPVQQGFEVTRDKSITMALPIEPLSVARNESPARAGVNALQFLFVTGSV